MNFLEAFEELNKIDESSSQHYVPPEFKYRAKNKTCPGCGRNDFKDAQEYEQHILGFYDKEYNWVNGCAKAIEAIADMQTPAKIKVGKKDHSYDEMTNMTTGQLVKYRAKNRSCEICGAKEGPNIKLVCDHEHTPGSSHSGTFRGILCSQCNLLLGQLERRINKQNPMHYEEYLRNIASYLKRAEKWRINPDFGNI